MYQNDANNSKHKLARIDLMIEKKQQQPLEKTLYLSQQSNFPNGNIWKKSLKKQQQ